eukprot:21691-Chlamydomonas_euryale.AAC.4
MEGVGMVGTMTRLVASGHVPHSMQACDAPCRLTTWTSSANHFNEQLVAVLRHNGWIGSASQGCRACTEPTSLCTPPHPTPPVLSFLPHARTSSGPRPTQPEGAASASPARRLQDAAVSPPTAARDRRKRLFGEGGRRAPSHDGRAVRTASASRRAKRAPDLGTTAA